MSTYVDSLLEKRENIWKSAQELLDTAAAEKRELSAEENVQYERMSEDMNALRARSDKLVEDEKNAKAAEASLRSLASKPEERKAQPTGQADELRRWLGGEGPKDFIVKQGPEAERRSAMEMRALAKGTPSAGGYGVATNFYDTLVYNLIETASLLRGGATILQTDGGQNLQVPTVASQGAAAAVAEAATLAGTDPTLAQRQLGAFKFGQLVLASTELVQDAGFDVEGFVAQVTGRAVGNAFGQKLIVGAGTTEPLGITSSTTLGVTGGTGVAGVPTMDNLIDLEYSVTAPYRAVPSAGWLMKDQTAGQVRKIKDSTNNYIWQNSVVAGTPDTLLGKPVTTDPYMPATGLGAKSVVFGDLAAYFVRLVNDIRFERSNDYAFASDQVAFRCIIRGDGMLIDQTGAVKHFIGGAS
jgi:HK97 family phage major capsid protein